MSYPPRINFIQKFPSGGMRSRIAGSALAILVAASFLAGCSGTGMSGGTESSGKPISSPTNLSETILKANGAAETPSHSLPSSRVMNPNLIPSTR